MPHTSAYPPVFVPKDWILPPEGTNGHISSWGAMLAGLPPARRCGRRRELPTRGRDPRHP